MTTKIFLAYRLLYIAYGLLPIVAGADKFLYYIGEWHIYINDAIPAFFNISMQSLLRGMGLTEIIFGVLVLLKPILGGSLVTLGLIAIALNIISTGTHYDVAVRDIIMAVGSSALVLLAQYLHRD
ncbi:hypothetical protein H0X06_00730 [Candidatus Dependentiae bacterium]|nr:hypothetical protein [Candidatus Dependentiae bacterium]